MTSGVANEPDRLDTVVSVQDVSKSYPGVRALDVVSLDLHAGEVHALVGENGAGKSTLIKILSGDTRPDSGKIFVRSEKVFFESPADARRQGIATIFQELMIVPEMSVAENVVLGDEPGIGPMRQVYSRQRAERLCKDILGKLGSKIYHNTKSARRHIVHRPKADHRDRARFASARARHHSR